ncbi:hypothetical protein LCGC14_0600410 [marine sediment metagenome]|uniref:NolW-like domain-containing protein n=1 Tax=marine sediment metagenome TaxID=412755 RepID=A0A0F9RFJ5_9ZZZZ|nr:hypothetical protein [Methylophaga sp.]HEC58328.1 hypothetical protein [Methylophaga sp.]
MKILIFALLSLMSSLVVAENKIETIQLNHRLAAEVLTEIQPFVPAGATARAANDFIILQASPNVIADIKKLINQLDTPTQSLIISVLKSDEALSDKQRTQIGADIEINEQGADAAVSINKWSTSNSRNKDQHYQARGIAGQPVTITTGQSLPQEEQFLLFNPHGGIAVQSTTNYIDINNGFQAIARIHPNHQVSIEIYPQFSSFSKRNGVIDQSQMSTNISGSVGTWLEIGQISTDKNIAQTGSTQYQTQHSQQQFIYLKVDEVISH